MKMSRRLVGSYVLGHDVCMIIFTPVLSVACIGASPDEAGNRRHMALPLL